MSKALCPLRYDERTNRAISGRPAGHESVATAFLIAEKLAPANVSIKLVMRLCLDSR